MRYHSRKIFIIIATLLFLTSCSLDKQAFGHQGSAAEVQEGQENIILLGPNGEECKLSLRMPVEEAFENLKKANIELNGDYTNQLYSVQYNIWFKKIFNASGKKEWAIDAICVSDPSVTTTKGLKVGDSAEDIERLYGKCEHVNVDKLERNTSYSYPLQDSSLTFTVGSDGIIFDWMISSIKSDGIELEPVTQDENEQPGVFRFKVKGGTELKFSLGMTVAEAIALLESAHMEYGESIYDDVDYEYQKLDYNGVDFTFRSKKNIEQNKVLIAIDVITDSYPTSQGLKVGDSESKCRSLYPNGTAIDSADGYSTDSFDMGGYYFILAMNDVEDEIYAWRLDAKDNIGNSKSADGEKNAFAFNPFFFSDSVTQASYPCSLLFTETSEKATATLHITKVTETKDRRVYELKLDPFDGVQQERLNLGYYVVMPDQIVKFAPTKENLRVIKSGETPEGGDIVCAETIKADALGKEKQGWHHKVDISGDTREYHAYDNEVETGYYETQYWQKGRGLVLFRSGYGAGRDAIMFCIEGLMTEYDF